VFSPRHRPFGTLAGAGVKVILYGEVDHMGHRFGPTHRRPLGAADALAKEIADATKRFDDVFVVSEHGMTGVTRRFDVMRALEEAGLVHGRDVLVWLDATLARIWVRPQALKSVLSALAPAPGKLFTPESYEMLDVPNNAGVGDVLLMLEPGWEVFPNYYHPMFPRFFQGLHGYSPDDPRSLGLLLSTRRLISTPGSLLDVAPTFAKAIGLPTHLAWRGRNLLA